MYSIEIIKLANRRAAAARRPVENEVTRHCSYNGTVERGVILHSAKKRSTGFLSPGHQSRTFLAAWLATNSADKRDALVESYF